VLAQSCTAARQLQQPSCVPIPRHRTCLLAYMQQSYIARRFHTLSWAKDDWVSLSLYQPSGSFGAQQQCCLSHGNRPLTISCHTCFTLLAFACRLRNHYVLNHHHVVKLKDVFLDDDASHLNLVLEYADGGVLLHHVNTLLQQNGGRISEGDAR